MPGYLPGADPRTRGGKLQALGSVCEQQGVDFTLSIVPTGPGPAMGSMAQLL